MLLLLLAACPTSQKPDAAAPSDTAATCDTLEAEFEAERAAIQACTDDADCGQVLTFTSCGCTRDLVARGDADTTNFYALLDTLQTECVYELASPCDCPEADGYDCDAGQCTWNYVDTANIRPCASADGDPYTLDAASIAGDTLTTVVSASGGCGDHDFTLCWPDQTFMESEPVQVRLELLHESEDICEAIESYTADLSLAPLKSAWQAAYGAKSGTITVQLDSETLSYSF